MSVFNNIEMSISRGFFTKGALYFSGRSIFVYNISGKILEFSKIKTAPYVFPAGVTYDDLGRYYIADHSLKQVFYKSILQPFSVVVNVNDIEGGQPHHIALHGNRLYVHVAKPRMKVFIFQLV